MGGTRRSTDVELRRYRLRLQAAPRQGVGPDWVSAAVLVLAGLGAAAIGTILFARRDLAGA